MVRCFLCEQEFLLHRNCYMMLRAIC